MILDNRIRMRLIRLGRTKDIELHWIKGHAGVTGNETADGLAKLISTARPTTLLLPMSSTQVKALIKNHVNEIWQERWRGRQLSWAFNWMPTCNRRMVCPPMENRLTNVFNSFVCNTLPLRGKLHQWGIVTSPFCHYHPGFRETPRHVLFVCNQHQDVRNNIVSYIRASTGVSEFSCKAIVNNPRCVKLLAEALNQHLEVMRPLNNQLLVASGGSWSGALESGLVGCLSDQVRMSAAARVVRLFHRRPGGHGGCFSRRRRIK